MKNFNYTVVAAAVAILVFLTYTFAFVMIPPGYVGVVVNMFGTDKGVEEQELHVGAHFIAPWKVVYKFPSFEQNHLWDGEKKFTFQTSEGLAVEADVGVTYHLRHDKIHILFAKYRRGMDEITDVFIRNFTRDAINKCASKLRIEDLYGPAKEKFFDDIQSLVRHDLQDLGIIIERIYLVGNLHFPDSVVKALNAKIEAVQRAQQRENELRESEAEAKKQMAKAHGEAESALIRARAQAESNQIISLSLTPELIQWQAVQKWNGQLPAALGNHGMMLPFMPDAQPKK
ncbi:prohibitin family protein [Candidatus Protochlamydia phocaeensis]|uniref:prohibitin family protein n=1 Tax=Candidatus Protochlamydia phocaeensis TaxID=1414722 RepID=UPI0008387A6D|nr:prohibitin family protein [Candidatus Protochlamydia phocaeensis]